MGKEDKEGGAERLSEGGKSREREVCEEVNGQRRRGKEKDKKREK